MKNSDPLSKELQNFTASILIRVSMYPACFGHQSPVSSFNRI